MPAHPTFVVTAQGRSGTKFLSHALNTSPTWTVKHEPHPRQLHPDIAELQARFAQPHYGEVNSWLRHAAIKLRTTKQAVIVRHPRELIVSLRNRSYRLPQSKLHRKLTGWVQGFGALDRLIRHGAPVIWFYRMVSEADYLRSVARWLGISDAELPDEIIKKPINATRPASGNVNSLEACSPIFQQHYAKVQWFVDRYFEQSARGYRQL